MTKIPNVEHVAEIIMHPTACVKCQIGQDWYKIDFTIYFDPDKSYPDYMEVQAYIMEHIDGNELNIEQAVRMLYDHMQMYAPKSLEVTADVSQNKVHFDVTVTIK